VHVRASKPWMTVENRRGRIRMAIVKDGMATSCL
jgi:hypothetical protein